MVLPIITQQYDSDLGSGFPRRTSDRYIFVTSNRRIPVKEALGLSAVVSCVGELIPF